MTWGFKHLHRFCIRSVHHKGQWPVCACMCVCMCACVCVCVCVYMCGYIKVGCWTCLRVVSTYITLCLWFLYHKYQSPFYFHLFMCVCACIHALAVAGFLSYRLQALGAEYVVTSVSCEFLNVQLLGKQLWLVSCFLTVF
jgi:hypothetical protein